MRKAALLLFTFLFSLPLFADEKHQSYIAFDDGGTVLKQSDDGREIEARVNMPVYPGDEVVTNRRGRAEVRLSDGNVVGVDRATSILFRSILDSYEGESSQTVAELKFGKVAVHRTELGHDVVRLDTSNASYVARDQAVYSVETDARGKDRVTVFDGAIEVRTRSRATRLREGESAEVDDRGVYDLVNDARASSDDFENWFLKRAERRDGRSRDNRYLDRRIGYWADDLDDHGTWVNVAGIGWSWRPYVAVGWRPYYHGYWHTSRSGCLTWVSYDPFGWAPYHYGRWAYDNFHGWIWVPGTGYSPAWVYWWYSPGYVGWAPAGWWDCHRGYYDWAYRPYSTASLNLGFGFYGRVRIDDIDLRPWTFLDANNIVSGRVDRAALTADVVKQRLGRGNGGFATVSSDPARFTREDFRNPTAAINRRVAGGFGRDTGAVTDVTPFIRRDTGIDATVRDRIVRGRTTNPSGGGVPARVGGGTSGSVAPVSGGSVAPIGRGSVAPITGGGVAPIGSGTPTPVEGARVNRGGVISIPSGGTPSGGSTSGSTGDDTSRGSRGESGGRINRGGSETPAHPRRPSEVTTPATPDPGSAREDSWRGRIGREPSESAGRQPETPRQQPERQPEAQQPERQEPARTAEPREESPRQNDAPPPPREASSWRDRSAESSANDVPRRVVERSSGTRVTPRSGDDSGSSRSSGSGRVYIPRSDSGSRPSGGSSAGSSSSGGSSSGSSSGSSAGSSSSGSSGRSNSGNSGTATRSEGGRIKRD